MVAIDPQELQASSLLVFHAKEICSLRLTENVMGHCYALIRLSLLACVDKATRSGLKLSLSLTSNI